MAPQGGEEENGATRPAAGTAAREAGYLTVALLLLAAIVFTHFFRLTAVPRGLYFDECSVGLNAALVAADGHDEHGVFLPVFFVTFGNLKNPLVIYTAALLFRLAGASDWLLRATPALCFLVFLAGFWFLAGRLFPRSRATRLYALAAAGFLPWFFTLSRFAMEDSSQIPLIALSLLAAHGVYERQPRRPLLAALGLGLLTGLTTYSYTTARLLTFLFAFSLVAAYLGRRYLARHAAMLAGFALALVPYAAFGLAHPGELTRRFNHVSYLHDPSLSLAAKIGRFATYYAASFSPTFLLVSGDPNRRHSTGFTGEVYWTVLALAVAGLVIWVRGALPRGGLQESGGGRFCRLLLLGTVAAPLGMALTEPQHAMRGVQLGFYLLLASCYGFAAVAQVAGREAAPETARRQRLAGFAIAVIALGLAVECGHMLATYFGPYAAVSEEAYLSYDFEGLIAAAAAGGAREVVVVARPRVFYALPAFYVETRRRRPPIPVHTGPPVAAPGSCIVYFIETLHIAGGDRYPSQLLGSGHQTLMRCYALPLVREPGDPDLPPG